MTLNGSELSLKRRNIEWRNLFICSVKCNVLKFIPTVSLRLAIRKDHKHCILLQKKKKTSRNFKRVFWKLIKNRLRILRTILFITLYHIFQVFKHSAQLNVEIASHKVFLLTRAYKVNNKIISQIRQQSMWKINGPLLERKNSVYKKQFAIYSSFLNLIIISCVYLST